MADDSFWSNPASTQDKSYAELTSGGVVRAALYSTMRANAPRTPMRASADPTVSGTRSAVSRVAASTGIPKAQIFATVPIKMKHSAARFSSPARGALTLRSPSARYKATGFIARPAKSITAGSATLPLRTLKSPSKMPANFSYTPSELTEVRDQKACGCCWAVSSTSMIADRVFVQSGFKTRCALSSVQMMECADYPSGVSAVGCEGNDPYTALLTLANEDKPVYLRAESKYPRTDYTVNTTKANCAAATADAITEYGVAASEAFMVCKEIPAEASDSEKEELIKENVENMKQSLYNEGPLVSVFAVPNDFVDYDGNTIYQSPSGWSHETSDQWHAVELVGWGKDAASGQEYWVCRNSWGEGWPVAHKPCAGMGFFYIALGKNMCGIEQYAAGVTPKVINAGKAPITPDNAYPGCGSSGGLLSEPVVSGSSISVGKVLLVVAIAGASYYVYRNRATIVPKVKSIFSKK
jgi:C1A family cysteine protease